MYAVMREESWFDSDAVSWAARRGRWQRLGLALLCGALMAAGHAPIDLPWGIFVAVPVLVLFLGAAPGGWAAAWTGLNCL